MKVILLEKITKLGNLGDQVEVKSGFGRNYLIPQGKATAATAENIAKFEARRAELGRLFGSVTSIDIVEVAKANNIDIERNEIRMPTGPIRATGEFTIPLHFHADVESEIIVEVVGVE